MSKVKPTEEENQSSSQLDDLEEVKETPPKKRARAARMKKSTLETTKPKGKVKKTLNPRPKRCKSQSVDQNRKTDTLSATSEEQCLGVLNSVPHLSSVCQRKLKKVILTALQLQRHSRRQKLIASDFKKALALHHLNAESDDSDDPENAKDSDELANDLKQHKPLFCSGKWLLR